MKSFNTDLTWFAQQALRYALEGEGIYMKRCNLLGKVTCCASFIPVLQWILVEFPT